MNERVWTSAVSPLTQDDTCLALSEAGKTTSSSGGASANQRSIRVKEQVKMSLARKATKNNGAFLQKESVGGVDVTSAYSSKLNGSSFHSNSATDNLLRRPTKRLEVSLPPSPETSSPGRFNHSVYQRRIQTSGLGQSQVAGSTKNFQRSISAPCNLRKAPKPPSAPLGRSIRQAGGAQSRFSSHVSRQTVGMKSVRQTVVKPEIHKPEQQSHGVKSVSGDNVLWLAQLRKNCQKSMFLKSYPPSVASSEKLVEVAPPVQPTQITTGWIENVPEITVDQALTYLIQCNEEKQLRSIARLQKEFLQGSNLKKKVLKPQWTEQLLQLLSNEDEDVRRVSAEVLRVFVYHNDEKKTEVEKMKGLPIIHDALEYNRDRETTRHLTGLLWNLSAHDEIKERFSKQNFDTLTRTILVPSSGIFKGENPKDDFFADAYAFYNATGCLRNLSSASPKIREQMRTCKNLIDSIVYYVRATVPDGRSDDESTENCICILQNLTYMAELKPELSAKEPVKHEKSSAGCFSPRSAKVPEKSLPESTVLLEKANPVGIEWLWNPIMIRTYLSLMFCSKRDFTRESAVGALQNITAGKGPEAEAIANFIAYKENGLQKIKKVLEEKVCEKAVAHLIRNLSRYRIAQPGIVEHVLEKVVQMLPNDDKGTDQPTEMTASLCHILINLTKSDMKNAKTIIELKALTKINNISRIDNGRGPSEAGHAACILLQLMWQYSKLHSYITKVSGLKKKHFINKRTNSVMEKERKRRKFSKI